MHLPSPSIRLIRACHLLRSAQAAPAPARQASPSGAAASTEHGPKAWAAGCTCCWHSRCPAPQGPAAGPAGAAAAAGPPPSPSTAPPQGATRRTCHSRWAEEGRQGCWCWCGSATPLETSTATLQSHSPKKWLLWLPRLGCGADLKNLSRAKRAACSWHDTGAHLQPSMQRFGKGGRAEAWDYDCTRICVSRPGTPGLWQRSPNV
jgi:hypothetical protein